MLHPLKIDTTDKNFPFSPKEKWEILALWMYGKNNGWTCLKLIEEFGKLDMSDESWANFLFSLGQDFCVCKERKAEAAE